jgi:hypothetical protein
MTLLKIAVDEGNGKYFVVSILFKNLIEVYYEYNHDKFSFSYSAVK